MPKAKYIGLYAIFALGGLVLGIIIKDWPLTTLKRDIDIADVIDAFFSLLAMTVAFYIASNLDRNKKKEEYQFNYVFGKLDDFKQHCKELITTISGGPSSISLIDSKIKGLNMDYQDFVISLGLCKMTINAEENKEIKGLLLQLKRLCTESPRIKDDGRTVAYTDHEELRIVNGQYIYSELRVDEIKNQINTVNNKLFEYTMNNK